MDKDRIKKELERQLTEINYRIEVLDMMDERLFKMKKLLEKIEVGKVSKEEEETIRTEISELEDEFNLLNRENNLQS